MKRAWTIAGAALLVACSASPSGFGDEGDSGKNGDGGFVPTGDGGFVPTGDGGVTSGGDAGGPAVIYAHTDTELYSIDPASISSPTSAPSPTAAAHTPTITDLAVDGTATCGSTRRAPSTRPPSRSGTGAVQLTLVRRRPRSGSKFYALGFTPAGVLGSGESLVAGDSPAPSTTSTRAARRPRRRTRQLRLGPGRNDPTSSRATSSSTWRTAARAASRPSARASRRRRARRRTISLAEVDMAALAQSFQSKSPASSR